LQVKSEWTSGSHMRRDYEPAPRDAGQLWLCLIFVATLLLPTRFDLQPSTTYHNIPSWRRLAATSWSQRPGGSLGKDSSNSGPPGKELITMAGSRLRRLPTFFGRRLNRQHKHSPQSFNQSILKIPHAMPFHVQRLSVKDKAAGSLVLPTTQLFEASRPLPNLGPLITALPTLSRGLARQSIV
jgi:hypothetical protein